MFKGIAASPGIAMGTAFVLENRATISQTLLQQKILLLKLRPLMML